MLIDDERRAPYPAKPRSAQQERADEVRVILREAGWKDCTIALWLSRRDPFRASRLDAVNEGGAEFEAVLAEAREIAGRR